MDGCGRTGRTDGTDVDGRDGRNGSDGTDRMDVDGRDKRGTELSLEGSTETTKCETQLACKYNLVSSLML